MSVSQRLEEDLKAAMRAGEKRRRDTIRLIRSALGYEEIERQHPLSEDETIAVLAREVKRRQEAIEAYRKGGREDLAAGEEAEKTILESYLPPPVTPQEIRRLAEDVASRLGAGPGQMGQVMGLVMPRLRGRAQGSQVAAIVRGVLEERGSG